MTKTKAGPFSWQFDSDHVDARKSLGADDLHNGKIDAREWLAAMCSHISNRGEQKSLNAPLAEGDTLSVFPPMAGG